MRVDKYDGDRLRQLANTSGLSSTTMVLKGYADRDHKKSHGHGKNPSDATQRQQHSTKEQPLQALDRRCEWVHLEADSDVDVESGTYVLLAHTYNISFKKYKCKDLGMVEDDSLRKIRLHYVKYLVQHLDLVIDVGNMFPER